MLIQYGGGILTIILGLFLFGWLTDHLVIKETEVRLAVAALGGFMSLLFYIGIFVL